MIAIDTLPASACVMVVPQASDNMPMCVLGAVIVGAPADHEAAAAWARAHGFGTTASKGQGGVDEQLIFFTAQASVADLAQLQAAHRAGQFGKSRLQVVVAPKAVAADGLDLDTEVRVGDIAQLAIPAK